ncbi:hypothetical protein WJX73_004468 [Symbiochloris irregularis]|uniref:ELYS-like domain-containing protein n=1 Tax=Symbiochloris irregularis TaxID=706552 RepID=A0AAW1NNV0_9CHLO
MPAQGISPLLQQLSEVPIAELCRRTADGERPVQSLYDLGTEHGLCSITARDDVERLYSIFDLAVVHGLGSIVLDYVEGVCLDPFCSSSDPLESTLLDGRCIKRWCQLAVQRLSKAAWQSKSRGLASDPLLTAPLAALNTIVLVSETLALSETEGSANRDSVVEVMHQARQLQQFYQVTEWAARQQLDFGNGFGRFASHQQWCMAVERRRSNSPRNSSLLQDHLRTLEQQHGCSGLTYPAQSFTGALQSLFLTGDTDAAAWHAKLALLLYYALDAGLPAPAEAFWQGFGIGPALYRQWHVRFLLDDAASGLPSSPASLQQAAKLLPACASPETPFPFLEALARLGQPHAALAALQARAGGLGSSASSLHQLTLTQVQAAVCLHLECGSVPEAFLQVRQHCAGLRDAEERQQHSTAALQALMHWAAGHKALGQVLQLPLDTQEEQVLIKVLERSQESAALLPLYWMQRGNMAAAALAQARLGDQAASAGSAASPVKAETSKLLAAAAPSMPAVQRSLLEGRWPLFGPVLAEQRHLQKSSHPPDELPDSAPDDSALDASQPSPPAASLQEGLLPMDRLAAQHTASPVWSPSRGSKRPRPKIARRVMR